LLFYWGELLLDAICLVCCFRSAEDWGGLRDLFCSTADLLFREDLLKFKIDL
jgi:hypothetical protein